MKWENKNGKVFYNSEIMVESYLTKVHSPKYTIEILDNDVYLNIEDIYNLQKVKLLIGKAFIKNNDKKFIVKLELILNKGNVLNIKQNQKRSINKSSTNKCVIIANDKHPYLRDSPDYKENKVSDIPYNYGDEFLLIKTVVQDTITWLYVFDKINNIKGYIHNVHTRRVTCKK